jgi:signal peptidase II
VAEFLPEGGGYAPFLHGKVVDMFYFPLFSGTYPQWMPWVGGDSFLFFRPVFNIADSAITTGVFMFFIVQITAKGKTA